METCPGRYSQAYELQHGQREAENEKERVGCREGRFRALLPLAAATACADACSPPSH